MITQVAKADSFAEVCWEDKIMPYVNPLYADESVAKGGTQVSDATIFRCLSDISRVEPFVGDDGVTDVVSNRTNYLLSSLMTHKTRRYGLYTFTRIQFEIGTSRDRHFEFRDYE